MRLLVLLRNFSPAPGGGDANYLTGLLSHFLNRGVAVEIACSDPQTEGGARDPVPVPSALAKNCSIETPRKFGVFSSAVSRRDSETRLISSEELAFFRKRMRTFKPNAILAGDRWLTPALKFARTSRTAVLCRGLTSPGPAKPDEECTLLANAQTIITASEAEHDAVRTWLPYSHTVLSSNPGPRGSTDRVDEGFATIFSALFPDMGVVRKTVGRNNSAAAPTVSVLLPVFNAARYLRPAIHSLLTQSWRDFELIAVDDGSTDDSKIILESLAKQDDRIVLLSRPNTGIVGALNDGLAVARGEFLARMDADDEAEPTRLAAQVARLRAEPGLAALGSAITFMDTESNPVKAFPRPLGHEAIERALLSGDGGAMIHPVVTFRTAAVRQVGGYRSQANYVEDLDLFLRLARIGRLANLPSFELRYRVHPESINFTKNAGRHAVKLEILREAWEARGLPFDPTRIADSFSRYADRTRHYREWAVTSLAYGMRRVAVNHGWQTVRLRPFERASWSALKYALTAPLPRLDHCSQP